MSEEESRRFDDEANALVAELEGILERKETRADAMLAATLVFLANQMLALSRETKRSSSDHLALSLMGSLQSMERIIAGARKFMGWGKPS